MYRPYIPRVLYVHDPLADRARLRLMLRGRGIECLRASSVVEAAGVASEEYFDAVLVERRLPDGDGLFLLRALGVHRPARAVLLVEGADRQVVKLARRAGYEACFDVEGADAATLAVALTGVGEPFSRGEACVRSGD